jgi:hypothetical protein
MIELPGAHFGENERKAGLLQRFANCLAVFIGKRAHLALRLQESEHGLWLQEKRELSKTEGKFGRI